MGKGIRFKAAAYWLLPFWLLSEIFPGLLAAKPACEEGYTLFHQAYWRQNDVKAYRETIATLIQLHLKNQNLDAALQNYEDFRSAGVESLPAPVWLELCRAIEGQANYDRAARRVRGLRAGTARSHEERPKPFVICSYRKRRWRTLKIMLEEICDLIRPARHRLRFEAQIRRFARPMTSRGPISHASLRI